MKAVLLVFLGGSLGTTARWALGAALPSEGGLPVTLAINVSGAFLMGLLTETFRATAATARTRMLLTFAGTGVLGGYTTYGMFAIDADGLIDMAHLADGVLYGGIGIFVGVAAAGAGAALVAAIRPALARGRVAP